jgi:hypothetical protein
MVAQKKKFGKESLTVFGEYAVIITGIVSIMGGLIAIFTYDNLGWTLACAAVFLVCLFIFKARLKKIETK